LPPQFATSNARSAEVETRQETWRVEGWRNLGFLALILAAVFTKNLDGLSETLMLAAGVGSWFATRKRIHETNAFNFHPIREAAWLFVGIFATMVSALDYLEMHSAQLGLNSELKFFWLTGLLSGALDNAPTCLTFLAAAMGLHDLSLNNPDHVRQLVATRDHELIAISLGAVFFGAMTYIGNGPNFMVKSIAEQGHPPALPIGPACGGKGTSTRLNHAISGDQLDAMGGLSTCWMIHQPSFHFSFEKPFSDFPSKHTGHSRRPFADC
jgi:Na+/H+ antiporter NhaD/arsenite permease-like protein